MNSRQERKKQQTKFFKLVYVNEDTSNIPLFEPTNNEKVNEQIINIKISEEDVFKMIKSLKEDKSPGPDQVHPKVLRETEENWSYPISLIFQRSSASGELPEEWKKANITSVFKKGGRSDVKNYRPVSLTSIVCKMMEKMI
jgi:hypothetical protein